MKIELEGKIYDLDIDQAKKLNLLKEDTRCRSWEDFKKRYKNELGYENDSKFLSIDKKLLETNYQFTKEEALVINAFSKLLKLRREWIGIWEPNWCNSMERKYYISVHRNEFYVDYCSEYAKTFSFPTKEMAIEFLNCFRNLFEQCKNYT